VDPDELPEFDPELELDPPPDELPDPALAPESGVEETAESLEPESAAPPLDPDQGDVELATLPLQAAEQNATMIARTRAWV
jgi:hypothetical protein